MQSWGAVTRFYKRPTWQGPETGLCGCCAGRGGFGRGRLITCPLCQVKGAGMGSLSQVRPPHRQRKEVPPPCAGAPHVSQPWLLTSEDSFGFSSFFQPTQGSGVLPVFIKGIAEASISPHDSSSSAWKMQWVGWGRALPCTWVGGHRAGAPLALGSLLGCLRLEAPARHLGTQLLPGFGSDSGWGRGAVPSPPQTPLHQHLVWKEAPSQGDQGSRGKPETILAAGPTEHDRGVSKCRIA